MDPRRTTVTVTLLAVALFLPWGARAGADTAPPVTSKDLPRLTAELELVTADAARLADDLDAEAARDGGLRVALERLAQDREVAQARLDARAREVYMLGRDVDPLGGIATRLASPGLETLAQRGTAAAVRVEQDLVDAVTQESAQVKALRVRATAYRTRLLAKAQGVLAAQDRARALLATARVLAVQEQAAAEQARLDAAQAQLDAVSASVTRTLTPAQTARSGRARQGEGPVLALVEAAGSGYPQGYRPTGQTISGTASWYGPGFVGNPTASGAPYDPERLTCANKEVPLGTVLHVSANGLSVNCLVNDRGPYVGDRVLDMSRAGARALGYDGLAEVVIEVLTPR